MKKMKLIICIILCITLLIPITASAEQMKPPGVVSEGLSDVVIAICNFFVKYFNEYGVSIIGMLKQGEGVDANSVANETTFNLTTVRVEDNKISNGIFNAITSNFYPKLMMLAIIVFLIGLIYIGVLTLMSAASAKRQEYMQKLNTWFFGLILMLAFGVVMVFMINLNNKLANTFLNIGKVTYEGYGNGGEEPGEEQSNEEPANPDIMNKVTKGTNTTGAVSVDLNISSLTTDPDVDALDLVNYTRVVLKKHAADYKCQAQWTFRVENSDGSKKGTVVVKEGSQADEWIPETGGYYGFAMFKDWGAFGGASRGYRMKLGWWENQWQRINDPKDIKQNDWFSYNTVYAIHVDTDDGEGYHYLLYLKPIPGKTIKVTGTGAGATYGIMYKKLSKNDLFGVANQDQIDSPLTKGIPNGYLKFSANGEAMENLQESMAKGIPPEDPLLSDLYGLYFKEGNVGRIEYALLYAMGVFQVLMLLITYITRTFMISFLIIVFPAVMAIYSIDKLNDNKSTIFTRWNKEFISNVFTNSMHALSYGIMFSVILGQPTGLEGEAMHPIVKVIALWFIIPSGQVLRSIFDIAAASAKNSDQAGLAALAGLAAMGKFGGDRISNVGNSWRHKNGGGGGSGGGGSGGGGTGGGGTGGGGGFLGRSSGSPSLGRRAGMGALRGLATLAGTGAVIAGGAIGATMGVARTAAAGEDIGEITKGGAIGAGVGAGLTKGGIDMGHAAYHKGAQGIAFGKEAYQHGQARAEEKRLSKAFEGQRENLRDFRVPEVRANVENGRTALHRPVQSTGTNATRYARDGNTYELRDGKEYRVEPNNYLYDEAAGGYLYENEAFATVDGDFSSYLGASGDSEGVGSSRFFIPVDNEGYMDLNNIRSDTSIVDEQIQQQFEPDTHYINTGKRQMNSQFEQLGINRQIREHESLGDEAVVNDIKAHIKDGLTSGKISQEQHDMMTAKLNQYNKHAGQVENEMAAARTQKTKQQAAVARNFAQSHVLRPFDRTYNVSNIQ